LLRKFLRRSLDNRTKGDFIGKLIFLAYSAYKKLDQILYRQDNKAISKLYIRMKNAERQIRAKGIFVTLEDMVVWTREWIKTFPEDYDIIVGIPRGGLMLASMIALKLGKPLSTPEQFRDGQYWMGSHVEEKYKKNEFYNVLLVDDNVGSERTIEEPARMIRSSHKNIKVTKAALIVNEDAVKYVDLYFKALHAYPPVGEWKFMGKKRGILAVDMDGVICEDCPPLVDMGEKLYTEWLRNAKPYLIPNFEIDYIVSNRLEKYRPETEEWLARHKVFYNKLILWDIPSKEERNGKFIEHKVDVLLKIKPTEYWESSYEQAKKIWETTKIPTICIDEMTAFGAMERKFAP
jgi:orotate phosphoribosyltransferase